MKYQELLDKVATLPDVTPQGVSYFVTRTFTGEPNTSVLTLVAHRDGTYTATYGDLRTRIISATDPEGRELRFPDEDSACDWAWEYLREARGHVPTYSAEQRARWEAAGADVQRRWDEYVREQAARNEGDGSAS
jgi:hypothetical protein